MASFCISISRISATKWHEERILLDEVLLLSLMMKLWEGEIYLQALLFNVENEAFEVFAFGMVDIDGVVNGLSELV